jgi:hypothetical protein
MRRPASNEPVRAIRGRCRPPSARLDPLRSVANGRYPAALPANRRRYHRSFLMARAFILTPTAAPLVGSG